MKFGSLAAILIGLILSSTFAPAAGVAPQRKSADGLDLPAAAPERKFHVTMAIGGPFLGERPEEVGRAFNVKKSAPLLAKHTAQDLGCDWFVLNVGGADVAGLGLTDGRVTKLVLVYETAPTAKATNLHKQIESHPDRAVKTTFKPLGSDKKPSLMITFEVDPIELYLATHTLDPKIADAIRGRTWLPEMTDEQALMVGDGPGKYVATYAPETKGEAGVGAGTVFAENNPTDIRIEIEARNKQEAREIATKRHKNLKDISKVASSPKGK